MEKLTIENFAGIESLEIDLNNINLLLGPQASGKSISAKLMFYFKSFIGEIREGIEDEKSKREIDKEHINKFNTYFPKESWPNDDFSIKYISNTTEISITRTNGKPLKLDYSSNIKRIINTSRNILKKEQEKFKSSKRISHYEISRSFTKKYNALISNEISKCAVYNQVFIPAGRSFFSNIQSSIFSFLSSNKSLDPFLIQFGSFYESFKRFATDDIYIDDKSKIDKAFESIISNILNSDYIREKDKDYLMHSDKRKVNLSNASSGQQEILPLLIILKGLLRITFSGEGAVLYIEEPEAHLSPTAQKMVVRLFARIFNSSKNDFQLIVTTHSPYILSSFNNLMYAGHLTRVLEPEKTKLIYDIVPRSEVVQPNNVYAYSLTSKKEIENLIDDETKLISQNILDDVSNEISIEFGKLLDLEM